MLKITIDGKNIKDKNMLHQILKTKLQFPDYYGMNLDALEDCLTETKEELNINLINAAILRETLGDYCYDFEELLTDVASENKNITVSIKSGKRVAQRKGYYKKY